MKKPFYILALSLSILAISCSSNRTIGVLFDRTSCFTPYYVAMDIPIHHTPHWWVTVNVWVNTFEYKDGSYFYYAPHDHTPNHARIKSSISDSLWNQRFGYHIYEYQFNPPGDSLFAITYEDIDESGLCWKDVHYLIPDSLCERRKGRKVPIAEKGGRCRVTIGYARVPQHEKKRYDKALESFRLIIIRDSDSVYQRLLDTSFSEFARFRYLSDPQNVIYDDTTKINMYYERKRK